MAMNREQLRSEVRENIKRTATAFADTRIDTHLDWAQERIADLHTFEEMRVSDTFSTTDSVKNYSFPERMKDIFSMALQDGGSSRKLSYVPAREFDLKVPRTQTYSTGIPSCYVDYGTSFDLFKTPDDIYVVNRRFSQYPRSLSTDTMVSDLVRKDKIIVAGATSFGFWALREVEDAEYWDSIIFAKLMMEAVATDHSAVDWNPIARGFRARGIGYGGEYWKSPFVRRFP